MYFGGWLHLLPWGVLVVLWMRAYEDVSHPCFWFPPIFFLYGVSFYIVVQSDSLPWTSSLTTDGEVHFASSMHLLALAAFLIGASRRVVKRRNSHLTFTMVDMRFAKAFLALTFLISLYHFYSVFSFDGLLSKQDIRVAKSDSIGLRLAPIYVPMTALMSLVLIKLASESRHRMIKVGLFFACWGMVGLVVTGERDVMLRIAIAIGVIYSHMIFPVNRKVAALGILAITLALPILQALKGAVLGGVGDARLDLYGIFGGEFKSAGRTFTILLERWPGFQYGGTLWWDIQRLFSIGPLNSDVVSTSNWFNRVFLGNENAGWGFTLVGELYLNFGMIFVFLVYALIGFTCYEVYRRQGQSAFWLAGYAVLISTVLHSTRGDVATLVGTPLKLILVPLFATWLAGRLFRRGPTNRGMSNAQRVRTR